MSIDPFEEVERLLNSVGIGPAIPPFALVTEPGNIDSEFATTQACYETGCDK